LLWKPGRCRTARRVGSTACGAIEAPWFHIGETRRMPPLDLNSVTSAISCCITWIRVIVGSKTL
jgi:hypothetical protein